MLKEIITLRDGANYAVPTYSVGKNGLVFEKMLEVKFCKGDKAKTAPLQQTGVITIDMLKLVRRQLSDVNVGELKSDDTTKAIELLSEVIDLQERRSRDRTARKVLNTMEK